MYNTTTKMRPISSTNITHVTQPRYADLTTQDQHATLQKLSKQAIAATSISDFSLEKLEQGIISAVVDRQSHVHDIHIGCVR